MKQKNYDAENLFKDYMQSVNADPTAIDDILSGERQPANHGARIKHSTGKMATVTAAAAVVAICAGIGLSNMNANDDSSVKSAATTSQTSSVLTPAKQITQSFKLEASPLQADGQLAKTTLTLTATDEDGKEIIKKYANEKSSSSYHAAKELSIGGKTANLLPEVLDSTGYHHEGDYRWSVVSISEDKVVFDFKIMLHKAAQEDIPFTVNVFMPSDKEYTLEEVENGVNLDPIIATANLTYKANTKQYEFASANGEKLTVSDVGIITHHDIGCDDDGTKQNAAISNMLFTFADGTSKTAAQLEQTITYVGGGYTNDEYSDHLIFSQPIGADKLTSITYDGITYSTTQQALFKPEMTEMHCSDHSLRATVKLTALNAEAQKVLDAEAAKYKNNSGELGDVVITPIVGNYSTGVSQSTPAISGNTLTSTLYFDESIYSRGVVKSDNTIDIIFGLSSQEVNDISLVPSDRHLTISVNKNMTERVFKSASGKTLWLHDYGFSVDMDSKGMDKYTYNNFEMTFEDGTVKTPFNTQMASHGGYKFGGYNFIDFGFKDKIDSTKVTSIKYAGETFTAQ